MPGLEKLKCHQKQDSQAASMYELGYCEGKIKHPPTEISQYPTVHVLHLN